MKQNHILVALLALTTFLFVACGDDDAADSTDGGSGGGDGDGDGASGGPLLYGGSFTDGETIAPRHKCLTPFGGGTGDNISPALQWSGGPEGTMSYALILFDTRYNMFHWAIWDIPKTATGLPEGIADGYDVSDPEGAHQISGGAPSQPGYFGPCSNAGATEGSYKYTLYALDTEMLDLTADSTGNAVQATIKDASLEMVEWEGTPE